jgi:holo-ACP synthase CitX
MAQAREHRASVQRAMLTKTGQVLVSFMLNIPGPVKTGALYDTAFDEGVRRIRAAVADIGAVCKTEISSRLFTGSEYYALLKADAYEVKRALCKAEEEDALGRLFDIDVLYLPAETAAGATASAGAGVPVKIGRSDIGMSERRCLLCDNDAHACARARTHTVTEIVGAIQDGIAGDWSTLGAKAILDLIIIMVMTCSMGKGCAFSAIPVFLWEGSLTLLASAIRPLITDQALGYLSLVGSVLIFCVGLNLVWGKKIRVANLLPAVLLAVIAAFLPLQF